MPALILLGLWLAGIVGWVLNVYQVIVGFINLEVFSEISGYLVIKTVCIFLGPVGSVLGWVGLFQ